MPELNYVLSGNNTGLVSAAQGAIASIKGITDAVNAANVSLGFKNGISALDALGQKLLVIQGNTALFGDSLKLQTQEVAAYQTALNSLLANGYDPMDGDVQRLKAHVDELTASLQAASAVPPPKTVINDTSPLPSAENLPTGFTGATPGSSELVTALNQQLAQGTINAQQYNAALLSANSTAALLGETTQLTSEAIEEQDGYITGLKQQLAELNELRITAPFEDLAGLNAEIQELEVSLQQATSIGKQGFDEFGNSIKGVSVQSINGQLTTLTNNLFGARQIARDLARSFTSDSLAGTVKNVTLLAVDFLFYAQNAAFATGATTTATAAIGEEGVVAAGTAFSVEALGVAFASLLTPLNLVVLGVAVAAGLFEAYEKNQKDATKSTNDLAAAQKEQDQEYGKTSVVEAADDMANLTEKISLAKQGFLDKTAVLKDYNDTLGQTIGQVNNLDEAEQKIVDNGSAYIQFLILKAQAENAINKASQDSYQAAVTQNKINQPALPGATPAAQKLNNALAGAENVILGKQLDQNNADIKASTAVAQTALKTLEDFAEAHHFNIYTEDQAKTDTTNFNNLQEQLDALLQKNSQLAGDTSGLTGYSKQVAEITKSYVDLNDQVSKYIVNVKNAVANGSITQAKGNSFIGQANGILSSLPGEENKTLNDARIQEAQNTADAINKINNDFGVKQESGYNQQLASVKKLYDSIVIANQQKADSLLKIEANYNAAISAAGGNDAAIKAAKANYDAQVQDAADANAKIVAARLALLPAIQAVDEKYIQQEQQTYDKITDIANQAFAVLDDGEESRTDKINLEWQKRIASANAYFDKLRDLAKAANLPQSAIDNINSTQSQVNNVLNAADFKQVSEEISKNFASAMQSAVQGFVSDFYTSITTLGATRQSIDEKYNAEIASASSQAAIDQINRIKQLEQQTTTSFGAIFSTLVSKFNSTFNESILNSFTKQLTENLGKTLIAPTAKQLQISPEEQAAQNVASLLKTAGDSLAQQIKDAGIDFYNRINGGPAASGISGLLSGASGGSAASFGQVSQLPGGLSSFSLAGNTFGSSIENSGATFHSAITDGTASLTSGAEASGKAITNAGNNFSSKIAGAAAAASLAGGLISGAVSPTSKVGQTAGGLLQGAGEGAIAGAAFGPEGAIIGAIGGGIIGGIAGLFSASKAQKELQQQQLEEAQQQTALLKASLAYTASVIGRDTASGIVTDISVGATGQLVATVSGKQLQFVLDRNAQGR